MSAEKYQQCKLVRKIGSDAVSKALSCHITDVAYLPQKYAKVGKVLKIRTGGEWINGWVVVAVYGEPTSDPPDHRKAIREHRKKTGDALPKDSVS